MSSRLLKVYHRLPAGARSAVATLRGWYLRRSRYGKSHSALTAEARERDHWTAAQWKTWREERIAYVLHRAATRVPYYRSHWEARRQRGDRAAWDLLENWPLLEKSAVRGDARRFLADDCEPRRMFREHTSGTTGTPVIIWRSRTSLEQLYAIGDLPMLAVHTNAEPLLTGQREAIAAAFRCPVRETYGMAETVAAASECPNGTLHQWPEFGHVEIMPDGELICTGLLNSDMPLIRYRVGDRGNPPANGGACACGRSLPT